MIETRKRKTRSTKRIRTKKPRWPKMKRTAISSNIKLEPLIEFLNLDLLAPAFRDKISGELNLILYGTGDHGLEALKTTQDIITGEVLPIVEPPGSRAEPKDKSAAVERLLNHLRKLIDRINRMDFRPRFILLPGEARVRLNNSDVFRLAERKFAPGQRRAHLWDTETRNPARDLLGAEQGLLKWLTGTWIVKVDFGPVSSRNSPLIDFYGIIAEGLVTGGIANLRRCPQCHIFFVAAERRERFCMPEHGREYYDEASRAKVRVEQSRARNS